MKIYAEMLCGFCTLHSQGDILNVNFINARSLWVFPQIHCHFFSGRTSSFIHSSK